MAEISNQPPNEPIPKIPQRSTLHFPSYRSFLLLWVPTLIAVAIVLLPIIYLIIRAADSQTSIFNQIFKISILETIIRTLLLAASVSLFSTLIAVPIAFLLVKTDLPLKKLWSILTPLPLVIPSYVGAYLLVSALGPRGMVQQWLEGSLGIVRLPDIYGFPGALYILTILSYPFVLLNTRAALLKLDPALEEASKILGHNAWQTFLRVILPQLRPSIAAGNLLVALYVLRDFGAVSIMRFDTFTRVIYNQYLSLTDRSRAASLALILVLISLGVIALESRIRGRAFLYRRHSKSSRPPKLVKLGRWRWPALLFCASIVMAGVVIPASNLFYWLIRGLNAGEKIGGLWQELQASISVSGAAAFITLFVALPIAFLSIRSKTKFSHLLERTIYLAFALPGIVIALALVYFGTRYANLLYQTLPMLILAYIVLFLPEAVGALRTSLLQVNPNLEEAARSLGRNPLTAFRKVTFKLIKPGIFSGTALVFLTSMKELPATLILAPIEFKTLAVGVWDSVSEAFFARAAAPALLLIFASSIPMAVIILRDQKDNSTKKNQDK